MTQEVATRQGLQLGEDNLEMSMADLAASFMPQHATGQSITLGSLFGNAKASPQTAPSTNHRTQLVLEFF